MGRKKHPEHKYDLNLQWWKYSTTVQGDPVYRFTDGEGDVRLGRYLMTEDELRESYIGMDLWMMSSLGMPLEPVGQIVDLRLPWVGGWYGYWVVSKDGQVDIFSGKLGYRPLLLEG